MQQIPKKIIKTLSINFKKEINISKNSKFEFLTIKRRKKK